MKNKTTKESFKTISLLLALFAIIGFGWYFALMSVSSDNECNAEIIKEIKQGETESIAVLYYKSCRGTETFNVSITDDTLSESIKRGVVFSAYTDFGYSDELIKVKWLSPTILSIQYSEKLKTFRKNETKNTIKIIYENINAK